MLLLHCFQTNAQNYIFFLHNRFIEDVGINGVHPEYGTCEYDAILKAFSKEGFTVLSEVRPYQTNARTYANKIVKQVDSLLKKGVKPSQITVIGTSKGGYIAQYVSGTMNNPELNFVFIGSCSDDDEGDGSGINFCGNILSIYEKTDDFGQSCAKTKSLSTLTVPHYKEIMLNTGIRHGYLYKALPVWIKPAVQWANRNYELKDISTKKNLTTRIDSLIEAKSERPFNGIIIISHNGETEYAKSTGFSDLDKKARLRLNEQFVVGSISKQLTAVMVLQEFEKGHLKLDVPICFYLPDLKQKWADSVNIHHLLTHTHGITALDAPLAFTPGTRFQYSQLGFQLMADIVERTSKKSFATLSDELFRSCRMENTIHPDFKQHPRLVNGYIEQANGNLNRDTTAFMNYVAAGAFISSVYDLVLWNILLHNGKLLSEDTYSKMISKHENAIRQHPIFGPTDYGYGITVKYDDSLLQLGHTGLAPGFVSMNFYFPATKTSLVILENVDYYLNDLPKKFLYHLSILEMLREDLKAK